MIAIKRQTASSRILVRPISTFIPLADMEAFDEASASSSATNPSDGGCATSRLHFVCILGKRHALRIRKGHAVIGDEIGPCPHDRCAKAAKYT